MMNPPQDGSVRHSRSALTEAPDVDTSTAYA
jgi:hypothetical protein